MTTPTTDTGKRVCKVGAALPTNFPSPEDIAAIEAEAAAMERPTQDEVDAVAARIRSTGYASDAVERFEDWTREGWGMESTFTTEAKAAAAVPCDECGHPESDHNSMSESSEEGGWKRWRWCTRCDKHERPAFSLADPEPSE